MTNIKSELQAMEISLEQMIDKQGLVHVLATLETICHEKADHIAVNWQDEKLANQWSKAAKAIYEANSKIEKLSI